MAWVAGDQLQGGKYTIERELGRGRFGITYLVRIDTPLIVQISLSLICTENQGILHSS